MTKPEFKMTEEEVFVGAMNAAITGWIAALGNRDTIAKAYYDYKVKGDQSAIADDTSTDIVWMASLIGEYAVGAHAAYRSHRLHPPKMQKVEDIE